MQMYIQELFEKYSEWKVLYYFFQNPKEELHVKEVARRLKVSPGTASKTLKKAAADGLMDKQVIANVHLYKLNRKDDRVKNMVRMVRDL